MEIRTFGVGERLFECRRLIGERAGELPFARLFLLPIPTARDKKQITGTDTPLAELCEQVSFGDAVAGYAIPENIKEKLTARGVPVYDGEEDEDFLLRNAEVTARGAIGVILTDFKLDITDLNIGIIGYGRIGSCLLRYLLYLGASVTVYTTRVSVARELCESGVTASTSLEGIEALDLLINTAPARLLSEGEVRRFTEKGRIIDLASGKLFSDSESVLKLASVPEKFYPVSAGRIYAEHILKFLSEEGGVC